VTAQYKAQLEAEAYSKKLQDQEQQNREWLEQQHQQFLRQEAVRKKNEQEILEMRRHQMHEEKSLERENLKVRITEEAKGRIMQERENADIHLRELRAKSAEERQTKLESISSIFSGVGGGFNALVSDKTKLYTVGGFLVAVAAGIYTARTGTGLAGKMLEARLGRPPLVRETSRWTFMRGGFRSLLPSWLRSSTMLNLQESIVLPQELSERLEWTTNSLLSARKNGTPFRHLLLYGAPGTGKTLFARTVARECNMDYAIMTGGDVGPLGKDAVNELNKLFNWANHSRKGMILFIDEAEAFLRQGRGSTTGMSEEMRNVLSAFLHHTGTESYKFCCILATNVRDILDRAVVDRIDEQFEFPLPGYTERRRMIAMFMDIYIYTPTKRGKKITVDSEINEQYLDHLASCTKDFSGRQLAKLVIGMQSAVFGSGTNTLTKGLADTVLSWKLANFEQESLKVPQKLNA